jgi:hypothetical protein
VEEGERRPLPLPPGPQRDQPADQVIAPGHFPIEQTKADAE